MRANRKFNLAMNEKLKSILSKRNWWNNN